MGQATERAVSIIHSNYKWLNNSACFLSFSNLNRANRAGVRGRKNEAAQSYLLRNKPLFNLLPPFNVISENPCRQFFLMIRNKLTIYRYVFKVCNCYCSSCMFMT